MSVKNGQLVRLPNSSSVAIETLSSGSIVAGVSLPGLGLNEQDWRIWTSDPTEIQSTSFSDAGVVFKETRTGEDVIEFNNGNLVVTEWQKILIKDSSDTYEFKYASDVILNSDSLVQFDGSSVTTELITSAFTITNQTVTDIATEDIDVYLLDGYIVHNPPGYAIYGCGDGVYKGDYYMTANDPGPNSNECFLVNRSSDRRYDGQCVQTCDDVADARDWMELIDPCGNGDCPSGDSDTATGPTGAKGQKGQKGLGGNQGPGGNNGLEGAKGATGNTGAQGPAGDTGPKGGTGDTGTKGVQGDQGAQGSPRGPSGVGPQGCKGL